MGIDVEIAIGLKKELPKEEYIRVANLWEECGPLDGKLTLGADNIENPETFKTCLSISSLSRYYSDCYERGPWLSIYGTLTFFRKVFNEYEPTIFYGGDCTEYISEMTVAEQDELMDYFCKVGESPYRNTDYTAD